MRSIPRPKVGQTVVVVLMYAGKPVARAATILFDKGNGIILEIHRVARATWKRDANILLSYIVDHETFVMPSCLSEVISDHRAYIVPSDVPKPLDRREFSRMIVMLPAAIQQEQTEPDGLISMPLELSPNGVFVFGEKHFSVGDTFWLTLRIPEELAVSYRKGHLILRASVLRVEKRGVAASFSDATIRQRELLLNLLLLEGVNRNFSEHDAKTTTQ